MPEIWQDDCWLFVFQHSFASQGWKLADNYAKNVVFPVMQSVQSNEENK